MKTNKSYLLYIYLTTSLISFSLFLVPGCKKDTAGDQCNGKTLPSGKFEIKEVVGDTAFLADTIFRDNYVQFSALDAYQSVEWKLGNDPRTFTDSSFSLSFNTALVTIPINFKGKRTAIPQCFPGDIGTYNSSQNLTVLEQIEKPILTLSPLVGRYKGFFTNAPADTFTVSMDYFDSTKYDVTSTGSKNFYWFSNLPNGFENTTNAAFAYPELKHGFRIDMGYKCFVFNYDSYHQGKAWLSHDTLFINYGDDIVGRKKFIGIKK